MKTAFTMGKTGGLRRFTALACSTALLLPLTFGTVAQGADMLEGELAETQVEFGTGWYIRGDLGSTFGDTATTLSATTGTYTNDTDLGNASTFGIGGGYMFGSGLRADVTINHYTGFQYSADSGVYDCGTYEQERTEVVDVPTLTTDANGNPVVINLPQLQNVTVTVQDNGTCYTTESADISATAFMANAYLDGPTFMGITPYAGAGIGLAMMTWNDFNDFDLCVGRSEADCRERGGGLHTLREGTSNTVTSFSPAFSVMLGGSYDISRNVKLDLGYRYTKVSETTIATAADNRFYRSDLDLDAVDIHEVRLGLRYEIW
ncbi:MAG: outer membrane beta-barrel protein [Pseudomonadota bacterium]